MTLDGIAALLESLGDVSTETSRRTAFDLIASLGHPLSLRSLLDSIQSSPEQLQRIAQRSFHHTNHFDKIVLLDEEVNSRFRLVLHLWRPPFSLEEVEDEQIHNHRNDFWSTVLFGKLESWVFVRSEYGDSYHETLYRPSRIGNAAKVNEYSPLGSACLRLRGIQRWHAGSTYYLHHAIIHRIAISQVATATLLLKGPHVAESTSLFSSSPWSTRRVELRPFDLTVLVDRFDFIRRNIP